MTHTANQIYSVISTWGIPPGKIWEMFKTLYNFLPPPPGDFRTVWEAAQAIAAVYDGPPII